MKNYQFNLIDSTYPVADAREVLSSLISDKIKFLTQKIFSLEERFSTDCTHLKERCQELKAEKKRLCELLDAFEDESFLVEIDCQVALNIKKNVPESKEAFAC